MAKTLKKEQVMQIPELMETLNLGEIAKKLRVHVSTIYRWVAVLKERGVKLPLKKRGRPSVL